MNHDDNDWTRGFEFIDRMGNADLYGIWDPAGAGEIFKGGAAPAWATDLATIPLEAWNALGGAREMPPAVACDRANRHGCTLNPLRGTEAEGIPFGLYTRFAAVPYGCPKDSLLLVCARDADGANMVEVYGRKDWKDGINALRAVGIDRNALAEYMQNGVRAVGAHTPCKANPRYNLVSDLLDALDISDAAGVREVGAALADLGGLPPCWPAGPEAEDAATALVNCLRRTGSSVPTPSAAAIGAFLDATGAALDEGGTARFILAAVQSCRSDAVRLAVSHCAFTPSDESWRALHLLRPNKFNGRDMVEYALPDAVAALAGVVGADCDAADVPWNPESGLINPLHILCAFIRADYGGEVALHLGGTLDDPDCGLVRLCGLLLHAMSGCGGLDDFHPVDLVLLGRCTARALADRDAEGTEAGPALKEALAALARAAAESFGNGQRSRYFRFTPGWVEDGSAPLVLLRWADVHGYAKIPAELKD